MSKRRATGDQLSLFGAEAAPPPRTEGVEPFVAEGDREIGAAVPRHVRLGTSSWTFPGWAGIVYEGKPSQASLVANGLRAYAAHPLFRTVGIDRSYYNELEESDLASYAAQLPEGFLAVSKVPREITTCVFPDHPSSGARAGKRNELFLDPAKTLDIVIGRYERAFADHAGPIVFELPPVPKGALPPSAIVEAIDRLLRALPRRFSYAFELRNRELMTPEYFAVLRAHGAAHVLNYWSKMPTIGEQLAIPGVLTAPFVVARVMLAPGARYDERKEALAPFDRIVTPNAGMRADIVRLTRICSETERVCFVIVNNKIEGSAPLTVRALAEEIASTAEPAAPPSARRP